MILSYSLITRFFSFAHILQPLNQPWMKTTRTKISIKLICLLYWKGFPYLSIVHTLILFFSLVAFFFFLFLSKSMFNNFHSFFKNERLSLLKLSFLRISFILIFNSITQIKTKIKIKPIWIVSSSICEMKVGRIAGAWVGGFADKLIGYGVRRWRLNFCGWW